MRLPIIPAWFPLRALALQGVMALCVLLFCFAPLWYVTWKLEADIKGHCTLLGTVKCII